MVKLHGQCNAPGEVIGATRKCRGGRGEKSDEKHQTRGCRASVGLMMCLGAGDGARTYGGELNTKFIPG